MPIRRRNVTPGLLTYPSFSRFFVPTNLAQTIVANVTINTLNEGDQLTIVNQPLGGICMTQIAADGSANPIQLMFRGSDQFGRKITWVQNAAATSRRQVRAYFSSLDEIVVTRASTSVNNMSIGYFMTDETDATTRPRFPLPAPGMTAADVKRVWSYGPHNSYDEVPVVGLTDFAVVDVDEDGDTFGVDLDLVTNTDFASLRFDVHAAFDTSDAKV